MLLEQIQQTNDIKKINPKDYPLLAEEIRQFLIEKISVTGGHLGSNLGAVELTMAMHIALNLPEDKIVWDVGHQSYTHKLLTGRREGFDHLRKYGGMSGFPKRKESDCDSFDTGHSSTSISAGLGLVRARDIQGKTNTVVSVIGDGALTGGMAYEALNNAARMETNFIIILNDNNMSISENVGGVSKYLNNIRTSNAYLDIKDNIYDALRNTQKLRPDPCSDPEGQGLCSGREASGEIPWGRALRCGNRCSGKEKDKSQLYGYFFYCHGKACGAPSRCGGDYGGDAGRNRIKAFP